MVNEFEIKKMICDVGRRIYNRNMVAANDGNISVKISDDEYNKMMNFLDSYFTYTYQEDKDEEKYERYLYYRGILSLINKENSYNSYLDYLNETYTPRYPYFSSELGYNGQNSYTYQYTK